MRQDELNKIQNFIEAGNGTGNVLVRRVAERKYNSWLFHLQSQVTLIPYAASVKEAALKFLKQDVYRNHFFMTVCSQLAERISEPTFDVRRERFESMIVEASERAFDETYAVIKDQVIEIMNRIQTGSDLERKGG